MLSMQMLQVTFARSAAPLHRSIAKPAQAVTECRMNDGTTMASNAKGDIVFAKYASGISVVRNDTCVVVNSTDGSYWYGDRQQCWYRLD